MNRADDYGQTPLWVACLNGHIDVARLCLTRGAKIDLATQKGTTPLAIAQKKGHATIVAMLEDVGVKATDKPLNAGDGAAVAEASIADDAAYDDSSTESKLETVILDEAPAGARDVVDANTTNTPSEAEPMKVLQSIWDASAVATASRGDLRFMPFSEGVDLSKLVELRTLKGHSDNVRCGVHYTFVMIWLRRRSSALLSLRTGGASCLGRSTRRSKCGTWRLANAWRR